MRIKLQSKETYDVFISYSRNDSNIASKVYEVLQNDGIKAFLDTKNIVGAQDFALRIAANILSSKIFLCLASDNYYDSKWAPDEIAYAKSHKHRESIYVYIIDNSELPIEYDLPTASINRRLMYNTPIEPDLVDDIKLLLNDQKIISKNPVRVDNNATSHIDIGINTPSFYSKIGFNFTSMTRLFKRLFKKKDKSIINKDSNRIIPD